MRWRRLTYYEVLAVLCGVALGAVVTCYCLRWPSWLIEIQGQTWAAWMQAVASFGAIMWASYAGKADFKRRRDSDQRGAVDVAVSVLRSVHGQLIEVERRFPTRETLRERVDQSRYFRTEYLDPIERLLDQIDLNMLGNLDCNRGDGIPYPIEQITLARASIWQIRDALNWTAQDADRILKGDDDSDLLYERNKIRGAVNQVGIHLNALIGFQSAFDPRAAINS